MSMFLTNYFSASVQFVSVDYALKSNVLALLKAGYVFESFLDRYSFLSIEDDVLWTTSLIFRKTT